MPFPWNSFRTRRTARAAGAAVCVVATAILPAPVACGEGGTAPPFFCGKTYVFAHASPSATVVAGADATITVETLHYLNLVKILSLNACPQLPAQVEMRAQLHCDGAPFGDEQVFGGVTMVEGFKEVVLEVGIPAGPPRVCELVITSELTFPDGSSIEQSTAQPIAVVDAAPSQSVAGGGIPPRIDLSFLQWGGTAISCGHPGDEQQAVCTVTNNDPRESATCVVTFSTSNVADVPAVTSGESSTAVGAFAVSDPAGGDTHLVAIDQHVPGCLAIPAATHMQLGTVVRSLVTLGPGMSADVPIVLRTYPLDLDGACSQGSAIVDAHYSDGTSATGCAGYISAVDRAKPPQFGCAYAGRACTATADSLGGAGPAVRLNGDASAGDDEDFRVNLALVIGSMQMKVNGVPITGGTPSFSGVTQIDGQHGRCVCEFSFVQPPVPPDASITMTYRFRVAPDNSTPHPIATTLSSIGVVAHAPNGYDMLHPVLDGCVHVNSLNGIDDATLHFRHQLSAIGVETGDFSQVGMGLEGLTVSIISATDYEVVSTWTALSPGTDILIGFDVANDFHGIATPVVGACAFPDGSCEPLTATLCSAAGGTYVGDGAACPPEEVQACCFNDGTCQNLFADVCVEMGGTPRGAGSACGETPCDGACCLLSGGCVQATPFGCEMSAAGFFVGYGIACADVDCVSPCCVPDGTCIDTLNAAQCLAFGGTPLLGVADCTESLCKTACCLPQDECLDLAPLQCVTLGGVPFPLGTTCSESLCAGAVPCCFDTGSCAITSAKDCVAAKGWFHGPGDDCATVVCEPAEACCLPFDGACVEIPRDACVSLGGTPQGSGSTCPAGIGPVCALVGACCLPNGQCVPTATADICATVLGGTFLGANTSCSPNPCKVGDINGDGMVGGDDLAILLGAWGPCQGPPGCQADLTGDGLVDGADLGTLLGNWGS